MYITNKEINQFFEKYLFLDDEIELYTKYNMKYDLKKIQHELKNQYKIHYNEIQTLFEKQQYTLASYHIHLLHNLQNKIQKIELQFI